MRHRSIKSRAGKAAVGMVLAGALGGFAVNTAEATLMLDIRTQSGAAKSATIAKNASITLDVFAVVTGSDGDTSNDGFGQLFAAFAGTPTSGTPTGTLTAANFGPFNVTGSNPGTASGLNVGPVNPADPNNSKTDSPSGVNWFYATYRTPNDPLSVIKLGGPDFKIGTLTLTATGDTTGTISVNGTGRLRAETDDVPATWVEDGFVKQVPETTPTLSSFSVGTPVVITIGGGSSLPGDVNSDGFVNQLDLNIVGANWLASGATLAQGDANGDTFVNQLDLNMIGANWLAQASAVSALSAVPEPASLGLLGAAAMGLVARRRRA